MTTEDPANTADDTTANDTTPEPDAIPADGATASEGPSNEAAIGVGVAGLEHPHAFGIALALQEAGAVILGFCSERPDDDPMVSAFAALFPAASQSVDLQAMLGSDRIAVVVTTGVPADRANDAIAALDAGRHVVADKPIAIDQAQLERLESAVAQADTVFSVWYSERFESRATEMASALLGSGAIGNLVEVIGLGPHRLAAETRPDWFFDTSRAGTLLTDLMTHQVEQFVHFAGVAGVDAGQVRIVHAREAGHYSRPGVPAGFADHAAMVMNAGPVTGYLRVDWLSPDGLDTWGDLRLMLAGTTGTIEVRKNTDLGVPGSGGDHLLIADADGVQRLDCSEASLPHAKALLDAIRGAENEFTDPAGALNPLRLCIQATEMSPRLRFGGR